MKTKNTFHIFADQRATAHGLGLTLMFLCTAAPVFAQPLFLSTGSNQPLQTLSIPVPVPAGFQSALQFQFGFSSDETNSSAGFLDAFSFTLQSNDGLATALILAADASGVSWAPPNPGGLLINPSDIVRTPISIPAFAQGFNTMLAYSVSFAVPTDFSGKPATLYLDLFDNLDTSYSLGWVENVALIPEPSAIALGLLGTFLVIFCNKRHRT